MLELGILGKIDGIADEAMRFYALIGLCVSTTGEIDRHLYRCYVNAGTLPEKDAAAIYYRHVKFSYRRDLAIESVRSKITDPTTLRIWDEIISLVQGVCGPAGARNLISHNPLLNHMHIRQNADGTPHFINGSAIQFQMIVSQSSGAVLAGTRPKQVHDFSSLKTYAYALIYAEQRLLDFQQRHAPTRP